ISVQGGIEIVSPGGTASGISVTSGGTLEIFGSANVGGVTLANGTTLFLSGVVGVTTSDGAATLAIRGTNAITNSGATIELGGALQQFQRGRRGRRHLADRVRLDDPACGGRFRHAARHQPDP